MPFWGFLSEFMSKFFSSFSKVGKNSNDSSHGGEIAGFQKAKTGGLTSKATVLVNGTNQTLYLRDKVGAAYGGTRFKIAGKSRIEVSALQHTFFKMIAYAVEEHNNVDGSNDGAGSSGVAGSENGKKKTSTDTNLTIDSDQLADNKKITITHNGSKYELECSPR